MRRTAPVSALASRNSRSSRNRLIRSTRTSSVPAHATWPRYWPSAGSGTNSQRTTFPPASTTPTRNFGIASPTRANRLPRTSGNVGSPGTSVDRTRTREWSVSTKTIRDPSGLHAACEFTTGESGPLWVSRVVSSPSVGRTYRSFRWETITLRPSGETIPGEFEGRGPRTVRSPPGRSYRTVTRSVPAFEGSTVVYPELSASHSA